MLSLFSARFPAVPTAGLSPGVDLSGWQAASIWQTLGWVEWSCAKVSEGTAFVESTAIDHSLAAKAKGIPWGLYHFAKFADVQAEAVRYLAGVDMVTRNVGPPDFHMLDLEAPAGGDVTVWAEQWCRTVEQASPLPVVVYTGAGWANQFLTTPGTGLEARPLWVAHYANSGVTGPWVPSLWSDWMIWQWSSSTALGSLDVNVAKPSFHQLLRGYVGGPTPAIGEDEDMTRAWVAPNSSLLLVTGGTYVPVDLAWPDAHQALVDLEAAGIISKHADGSLWRSLTAPAFAALHNAAAAAAAPAVDAKAVVDELGARLAS